MALELAALTEVRARAASRDHAAVLRLTGPSVMAARNTFAAEMSVLRIDALMATGAVRQAKSQADAFLKVHPDGPLAAHVRSILSAEEK